MKKLNLKTKKVAKLKSHPILDGIPDELKDVDKYAKIEKELFLIMQSDHKHSKIKDFITCAWCQQKHQLRINRIKSLGFSSINQYLEWKKIMDIIYNKRNIQLK